MSQLALGIRGERERGLKGCPTRQGIRGRPGSWLPLNEPTGELRKEFVGEPFRSPMPDEVVGECGGEWSNLAILGLRGPMDS